jgi:hypothetical protein
LYTPQGIEKVNKCIHIHPLTLFIIIHEHAHPLQIFTFIIQAFIPYILAIFI